MDEILILFYVQNQGLSKEEVEKLLRCGAYDIFSEEQSGTSEKESNDFIEQDIDSILARRTKTVIHENTGSKSNAAGGTFSKASFTSKGGIGTPGKDIDIDDPEFWKKMVGEAKVNDNDDYDIIKSGKKRARKHANYNEKIMNSELDRQILLSGNDSDSERSSSSVDSVFSDNQDQNYEYNLANSNPRRNSLLNELLVIKRAEIAETERRRWGGFKKSEWTIKDAELVLSCLHKYGYNNVKWDVFLETFRRVASKDYDTEEIQRMCWALSLTTLVESVHTDVNDVAKRIEKAAIKKKEQEENQPESVMTQPPTETENITNSDEWKRVQSEASFKKICDMNKWVTDAIEDAAAFANKNSARDISIFHLESHATKLHHTPLLDSFIDNIWPALRTRGWVERVNTDSDHEKMHWLSPNGKTVSVVVDVYFMLVLLISLAYSFLSFNFTSFNMLTIFLTDYLLYIRSYRIQYLVSSTLYQRKLSQQHRTRFQLKCHWIPL